MTSEELTTKQAYGLLLGGLLVGGLVLYFTLKQMAEEQKQNSNK